MSEIKVDTIVDAAGTGKPDFSNGVTINGAALSTLNLGEYNASSSEPNSPENGSIWWDTTNEKIFIYIAGEWKETIGIAAASWYGDRGIIAGGTSLPTYNSTNTIQFFDISSLGNASDFGDLTRSNANIGSVSDGSRFVHAGGESGQNVIDYGAFATTGNSTDFGDLTLGRQACHGASDGTTGIFMGGWQNSVSPTGNSNVIDSITIQTTGNASDHGDLTVAKQIAGNASNGTNGFLGGGEPTTNGIDQVSIGTAANATDFGDLTVSRSSLSACADPTRAVFCGGYASASSNVMDYITMASAGNATDFGDMSSSAYNISGTANATRGVISGLANGASYDDNQMEYITIQTTGNAADFGDMTINAYATGATSGSPS